MRMHWDICAGGQRWDSPSSECPSLVFLVFILRFLFLRNYTQGLAFVYLFILHSSPLLQCTFHAWLTSGNAAGSVRKFEQTMEALEKAMEGPEASGGVTPGVKISDTTFAGVPVRVFEPPAGGEGHLRRGLMYIHGGGWTRGGASEYRQTFNRNNLSMTASEATCLVLNPCPEKSPVTTNNNSSSYSSVTPSETKPCDKVNKMLSDELNAVVVSVE